MLAEKDKIFNNLYAQNGFGIKIAKKLGDFAQLGDILAKGREFVINEITESGLKGRGGAFFSTGLKLSFINPSTPATKYFVVNADEGEPGTCKDRDIIRNEPYKLIEGCIINSYVIGAKTCYIYVRGEFYQEAIRLQKAIDDCYKEGLLGSNILGLLDLDIHLHMGAGAYICGEETALLESLEGKKGFPRIKPPFPAVCGLYGCPTLINNVETTAVIPTILKRGAAWFKSFGVPNSYGTKLFCISGHVNNPCVVEEALGIGLKDLIETHAGGVRGGWDNLLAVIPGGSSTAILPKSYCDNIKLDVDSLREASSSIGTGAVMVFDKSVDIMSLMQNIVSFYHHESCGQCSPCREGSGVYVKMINALINKKAPSDVLDTLEDMASRSLGTTICALNDANVFAINGFLRHYRELLLQYTEKQNG